jgi:LemA protein
MLALWIIIAIVVLLALIAIGLYNSLISLKNRTEESWSDIDVQLKRRYDLIPNLVSTVKGYAKQESSVFEHVTKARSEAMSASGVKDQSKAENALSNTLKSLFAVSENYPQLRSSENFKALQDELTDTENKISAARRFYNTNVRDLNIKIEKFPSNIVANSMSMKKRELFETESEKEKEAVEVKF